MRGVKSGATGRTAAGAPRRPSYPADQWLNQAKSSTKIWVKIAMGIAYFFCVSVAAFFLAIYYVFFWSPDASHSNTTDALGPNKGVDCGGAQTPAGK